MLHVQGGNWVLRAAVLSARVLTGSGDPRTRLSCIADILMGSW